MGSLTYTEFRDYVSLNFGDNTAWSTPTDFYGIWVNMAYKRLTTQDRFWGIRQPFYFPQLETSSTASTVDGTAYVSVPTDCLVIREVYDTTNNYRLTNIPHSEYVGNTDRTTTTSEAKPVDWVRRGTYIYLHPTPDSAYTMTIFYRKVPASMSGGSDVTLIGTEWDEPIVTLAAHIGKLWTMDYANADILKNAFIEQASGILTIYGQEEKARDASFSVHEVYRDRSYR